MAAATKRKNPQDPPFSVRLPREDELELEEECRATGRARNSIVIEALRIRHAVLEAVGIEAAGTDPGDLPELLAQLVRAGLKASAKVR